MARTKSKPRAPTPRRAAAAAEVEPLSDLWSNSQQFSVDESALRRAADEYLAQAVPLVVPPTRSVAPVESSNAPPETVTQAEGWNNILSLTLAQPVAGEDPGVPEQKPESSASEVFVSPFASLAAQAAPDELCVRCKAAPVHIPSVGLVDAWFCICCTRPVPITGFAAEDRGERTILRRCFSCAGAAPTSFQRIADNAPGELTCAPAVLEAHDAVWAEVVQYDNNFRGKKTGGSVAADPRLERLAKQAAKYKSDRQNIAKEAGEVYKQGDRGDRRKDLFIEWLVIEHRRVAVWKKKTMQYCTLLAKRKVAISDATLALMVLAGLNPCLPKPSQAAVSRENATTNVGVTVEEEKTVECFGCKAVLSWTQPTAYSTDLEGCHCCRRRLLTADIVQKRDEVPICTTCSPKQGTGKRPEIAITSAKVILIMSIGLNLLAQNAPSERYQTRIKEVKDDIKRLRSELKSLNRKHRKQLSQGKVSVKACRRMFNEANGLLDARALVARSLVGIVLELAVAGKSRIPAQFEVLVHDLFRGVKSTSVHDLLLKCRQDADPAPEPQRTEPESISSVGAPSAPSKVKPLIPIKRAFGCRRTPNVIPVVHPNKQSKSQESHPNSSASAQPISHPNVFFESLVHQQSPMASTTNIKSNSSKQAPIPRLPPFPNDGNSLPPQHGCTHNSQQIISTRNPQESPTSHSLPPSLPTAAARMSLSVNHQQYHHSTAAVPDKKEPVQPHQFPSFPAAARYTEVPTKNPPIPPASVAAREDHELIKPHTSAGQTQVSLATTSQFHNNDRRASVLNAPASAGKSTIISPVQSTTTEAAVDSCDRCSATLTPPKPGVGIAMCDCCMQVLPPSLFTASGRKELCNSCMDRHQEMLVSTSNWPKRWSHQEFNKAIAASEEIWKSVDVHKPGWPKDVLDKFRSLTMEVHRWRSRRKYASKFHCDQVARGNTPVWMGKKMYEDRVGIEDGLKKALEEQLNALGAAFIERKIKLPKHLLKVLEFVKKSLCSKDSNIPKETTELTNSVISKPSRYSKHTAPAAVMTRKIPEKHDSRIQSSPVCGSSVDSHRDAKVSYSRTQHRRSRSRSLSLDRGTSALTEPSSFRPTHKRRSRSRSYSRSRSRSRSKRESKSNSESRGRSRSRSRSKRESRSNSRSRGRSRSRSIPRRRSRSRSRPRARESSQYRTRSRSSDSSQSRSPSSRRSRSRSRSTRQYLTNRRKRSRSRSRSYSSDRRELRRRRHSPSRT